MTSQPVLRMRREIGQCVLCHEPKMAYTIPLPNDEAILVCITCISHAIQVALDLTKR